MSFLLFNRSLFNCLLFYAGKLLGALLLMAAYTSISHAATYNIDPARTNVRFAIDYFNKNSTHTGGFYNVSGQLQYDSNAQTGNISLIIPIKSLNTGSKAFNQKLIGLDFFDIERFPLAHFKSTKWYFMTDKTRSEVTRVDGKLTLHGETHPVTLTATKFNCYVSPARKNSVCGGGFTTTIDRTKWKINKYALLGITKNLTLNIQVEAAKQ